MQKVMRNAKRVTSNFGLVLGFFAILISGFLDFAPVALAAGDGCNAGANAQELNSMLSGMNTGAEDLSCQKVTTDVAQFSCVKSSKCTGDNVLCCIPGVGSAPAAAAVTAGTTAMPTAQGSLLLPACINDGNCSLNDIVTAGASFANFLFGLAGMVALGIMVYAGILYVFFAAQSDTAGKAKKMLVQAAIGLVIIFGANTLIRFVRDTLVNPASTVLSDCDKYSNELRADFLERQSKAQAAGETAPKPPPTWSCVPVTGPNATKEEINQASLLRGGREGCLTGKCRLPGQGANVLCCPSEPLQ